MLLPNIGGVEITLVSCQLTLLLQFKNSYNTKTFIYFLHMYILPLLPTVHLVFFIKYVLTTCTRILPAESLHCS